MVIEGPFRFLLRDEYPWGYFGSFPKQKRPQLLSAVAFV